MSLEEYRRQYTSEGLNESDADPNPFNQFDSWLKDAGAKIKDPTFELNAMALATSDKQGHISNRIVLLKSYDENGIRFFTNYDSLKGQHLAANPNAALLFYWPQLERQIRIEGSVTKTPEDVSKRYFDSRPRKSRISAVISPQSKLVESRAKLENAASEFESGLGDSEPERPGNWGGYELTPSTFEFWQGRENRLHDRLQYIKLKNEAWQLQRLGP